MTTFYRKYEKFIINLYGSPLHVKITDKFSFTEWKETDKINWSYKNKMNLIKFEKLVKYPKKKRLDK